MNTMVQPAIGRPVPNDRADAVQLQKLNALLRLACRTNPFYRRKLGSGDREIEVRNLDDFRARVPYTTKHELVKDRMENPPYGTNLSYPLESYSRCHQTSGSTSVPIRWLDTQESWDAMVGNWRRIFEAAGITVRDRFFFAFSFGPFLGFWSAIEAVHQMGCFCFPGGGMSSLGRAQAILDNKITVLCCTPTYAQHLAETARQKGLDLSASQVRLVIVAGESGGSIPATRARIGQLWPGAFVFDHHGMTEVGPVSYQCPAGPGVLHVIGRAYIAEVIDPQTARPVESGETGELVLTTLDRLGSPVLRYRTGDLVRPGPAGICRCGTSDLALHGGLLGRADDMVVVRGVNVYPGTVEEIIRRHPEVTEYRVKVDSRGPMLQLSIEVEPLEDALDSAQLQRRLEETFQAQLNLRVPVEVSRPGSLPRFEMKARRWVRITEGVV